MDEPTTLPDGVSIRPATPADVPALHRLQLAMALELLPDLPAERIADFDAELHEHLRRATASRDERAFLARTTDGEPVATGTLRVIHDAPFPRSTLAGEAQVVDVYTAPGWRRRGLGRALTEACLAEARELGIRRVFLRTTHAARPLYESMGFADPGYVLQLDLG
jgi:GNAT superfamily N-acetyltransferase